MGAKKKRKAKRTPKQIAATKRLVALNKKRRGKKTAKKKARRKNPAAKKKDHLWLVFAMSKTMKGNPVYYMQMANNKKGFGLTSQKGKAVLFQTKGEAEKLAKKLAEFSWHQAGVANASTTAAEIRKACRPKK